MDNAFSMILAGGVIILVLVFAILIAFYVLESMALYTIAKNNGQQDKAVLAWIPFINQGFYGFLAGDQNIFGTTVQGTRLNGFLFYVVALCGIAVAYFTLLGLYKKLNNSGDPTVMAVVSAILPPVRIIYVFVHRNDTLTEEGEVVG